MRKTLTIVFAMVFVTMLLTAGAFASGHMAKFPAGKEVITYAPLKADGTAAKEPVAFSHKAHAEKAKACDDCHHQQKPEEAVKACKAAGCHVAGKGAAGEGKTNEYDAMHKKEGDKSCVGCHKTAAKGPQKCAECHVKK
jgi:hypothetical protein